MRNLLKFLIRMHIVPVFVAWTSQIALTEIEAMRLAEAMGVDIHGFQWWIELYDVLCREGFLGVLQIRMGDFIITMGGEDTYNITYPEGPNEPFEIELDLPSEEELV